MLNGVERKTSNYFHYQLSYLGLHTSFTWHHMQKHHHFGSQTKASHWCNEACCTGIDYLCSKCGAHQKPRVSDERPSPSLSISVKQAYSKQNKFLSTYGSGPCESLCSSVGTPDLGKLVSWDPQPSVGPVHDSYQWTVASSGWLGCTQTETWPHHWCTAGRGGEGCLGAPGYTKW